MHLKLIENWKLKIENSRKGFTLIELLITIFLVSVGLIGVIAFFNASLQSQFDAKNEVVAAGLAQEGTELIRNVVEYNFLNPDPVLRPYWWSSFFSGDGTDIGSNNNKTKCQIDSDSLTSHICKDSNGTHNPVCINELTGRYYQCNSPSGGSEKHANFSRQVSLEVIHAADGSDCKNNDLCSLASGDCIKTTAIVYWPEVEKSHSTIATDVICKPRQ